jgi:primosomal protein N' (replication factor Y)
MIGQRLQRGEQVLLFLNRRGYAPVMMCHDCGWLATCSRCESQFTLHQRQNKLSCHHCDASQRIPQHCPECQSTNVTPVGQGTERIEETLKRHFKDYRIARIDRDSTRRKGAIQDYIEAIKANEYQLLVGTQMLAKGHHFPNLSLVVIIDMDAALYCTDFRATERFGQLLKQVGGRAGRADKQGQVVIQSRQPDHPHLQRLLNNDYDVFLEQLLTERQQTQWPPLTHLALLKAEATRESACIDFLQQIKKQLDPVAQHHEVVLLGPTAGIQHKRAGKYRYHLLLQCSKRPGLHQCIAEMINLIEIQKLAKSVRWTLDVDPLDLV